MHLARCSCKQVPAPVLRCGVCTRYGGRRHVCAAFAEFTAVSFVCRAPRSITGRTGPGDNTTSIGDSYSNRAGCCCWAATNGGGTRACSRSRSAYSTTKSTSPGLSRSRISQPHVRTTPFAARGQLGRNDRLPVVVGVGVSQLQISTRRVGVFLIPNCMPVVAGPHGRVGAHAWDPAGRPE